MSKTPTSRFIGNSRVDLVNSVIENCTVRDENGSESENENSTINVSKEGSTFNIESSPSESDESLQKSGPALGLNRNMSRQSHPNKCRVRTCCTSELLQRRLPFLQWGPHYNIEAAISDVLAGITVALTAIPQGIAYGAVAGLPIEYGLYTAFAGPFIYALFGSMRQVTVGPTAVMAIMTRKYVDKGGIKYAIALSFLAGCVELAAGLLNLGFLMEFISGPVISGFCSAAAVTVIVAQLKPLLGLSFPGSSFTKVLQGVYSNWRDIQLWDTVLGGCFIIFLFFLKNLGWIKKQCKSNCCLNNQSIDKVIWSISTYRNALAVFLGCFVAYLFEQQGLCPFTLTGEIKSGIPSFQLPEFSYERLVEPMISLNTSSNWTDIISNKTFEAVTFSTIISDLGTGLAIIPMIAILEQVAIAKAFSYGAKTDSTQEMIALGLSSIFSSFFGCFPLTASFTRSSVMSGSGVKTQFANFFNGAVILLALSFLMPTFSYIPKSVLGAVIVMAVYGMVEYGELAPMWKGRRVELIPFGATFFSCLLINIEYGIMIGVQVHLLLLAYDASRSKISCVRIEGGNLMNEMVVLRVDRNLYFPSVDRFRNALTKATYSELSPRTIVLDFSLVTQVDYTSLKMLKAMLSVLKTKGEKYEFINVCENVKKSLQSVVDADVPIVFRLPLQYINTEECLEGEEKSIEPIDKKEECNV